MATRDHLRLGDAIRKLSQNDPTLTELDSSFQFRRFSSLPLAPSVIFKGGQKLSTDEAARMAKALSTNSVLTALDLHSCGLKGAAGFTETFDRGFRFVREQER